MPWYPARCGLHGHSGQLVPPAGSAIGYAWEVDGEAGALAELALHLDAAALPSDDSVGDCQAQPRSHPERFGGEEGLEEIAQRFWRHPSPRVADLHAHLVPGSTRGQ